MPPPAANWCVRLSAVVAGLVISFGLLVPAATFASPPIVTAAADTLPVEDDTTPPDPALVAADTAPPDDTSLPDPSAPAGAYDIYPILGCQCFNGQTAIAYRKGYYEPATGNGFGHAKVLLKHNMYTRIVAFIVKGPNHKHTTGKAGEAWAYADKFVNGVLVQEIKILAKYDTRHLRDNHSFGIVTAWCDGYQGMCPDWVNKIGISSPAMAPSADGDGLAYTAQAA